MFEQILANLLSKEGIFAVLFVVLFIYQIRDSRERELRLMQFIDDITAQYEKLADGYEKLSDDVREIRQDINDLKK